jgi:hypothetical protein
MANGTETTETTEQAAETRQRVVVDILKPETCPPALRKFYTEQERDAIRLGLENKQIVTEQRDVKVSKDKSGTGQEERWPYIVYRAVEAPGMTALARGRAQAAKDLPENFDKLNENQQKRATFESRDGACDYFNYGFSLTLMQPIRVMLANSLGGVEKEIEKQIAQVMKTGLFSTADDARTFIIAQREKQGLEIPAETGE